jgi:hypothetical protein
MLRLVYVEHTLSGTRTLLRGWRESRRLLRQPWEPMSTAELDEPQSAS